MALLHSSSVPAILLYCIVAAAALIYFPFLVVAYGRVKAGYNQFTPRALFDKLPAFAQRATWAHENAFESFMLFATAALMAYVTQVSSPLAAILAIAYVLARFCYSLFYILNMPIGRSLMFGIGTISIVTLMILSLRQIHF